MLQQNCAQNNTPARGFPVYGWRMTSFLSGEKWSLPHLTQQPSADFIPRFFDSAFIYG